MTKKHSRIIAVIMLVIAVIFIGINVVKQRSISS